MFYLISKKKWRNSACSLLLRQYVDCIITESFGSQLKMKNQIVYRLLSSHKYEDNNPNDRFAIKTGASNGEIVGHLPREISSVTKFFLDHGAVM